MNESARPVVWAVIVAAGLAVSCGGGGGGSYGATTPNPPAATNPPADSGTMVVGVLGDRGANSFAPNPASAKVGQKVAWKNQDGIVHRIVQDKADSNDPGDGYGYGGSGGSSDSGFDGGATSPGATSGAMTLNQVGTFRYHCAIHPGMTGSIVIQ